MKMFFILVVLWSLTAPAGFAGTIVGTVIAQGKTNLDNADADGAYASRKYKFVPKVDYAAMHDFIVYVEGSFGTNVVFPAKTEQVTTTHVKQEGAEFLPHVLPVMAGTTVEWPNNDSIYHNVFSISEVHPFDLDLYKGNPKEKAQTFDRPGRVDVFCSIHANMHCVVLVLQNPYFAATDGNGRYTITNVPPGTYKLKAWQERMPADEREITVPTNGEVKADFVLGIKNLPQY